MITGFIGDIARHRTGDGPGIRTVVFFKGCPLHCPWCHNPEFIVPQHELAFYPDRCIGCRECADICPQRAIKQNTMIVIDRSVCDCCGECAKICPSAALAIVGRFWSVEELLEVLLRDQLYYQVSGGGVTLSGGEPTMQMKFGGSLLRQLKKNGIHTAIETNGFFSWGEFAVHLLPWLDLVLFDLKIADKGRHAKVTGQENEKILGNLEKLVRRGSEVVVRIPLIPGVTADRENLAELAGEMKRIGVQKCSLLPYHFFGRSKAANIGRPADSSLPDKRMTRAEVDGWHQYFKEFELV
ncbi:MAG: glycyl-radical enzyme activating protein [Pseudomonadota bacterium]